MYSPKDNPFAKGVSINQDIVMEDGGEYRYAIDLEGAWKKRREEVLPNDDRHNADLYANHPTLEEDLRKCFTKIGDDRRQLLALGREEE